MPNDRLSEVLECVATYGDTSGWHSPVYRVLLTAANNGQWAVGEAQCLSMLTDPVARRWMTDEEEQAIQALWSLFNVLRRNDKQPEVVWDFGQWVHKNDPKRVVMGGPWILVGWKGQ